MVRSCATFALGVLGWLSLTSTSHAQITIWGGESARQFKPGVYVPYDGAPATQNYNYATGSFFYLGGNSAQQLWMLDYYDKVERANKFGYPEPVDPLRDPGHPIHRSTPAARATSGWLGLGIFRAR